MGEKSRQHKWGDNIYGRFGVFGVFPGGGSYPDTEKNALERQTVLNFIGLWKYVTM